LNELADKKDNEATLSKKKINRIALFKSRFGEIEYVDITDFSKVELEKSKENMKTYFNGQ